MTTDECVSSLHADVAAEIAAVRHVCVSRVRVSRPYARPGNARLLVDVLARLTTDIQVGQDAGSRRRPMRQSLQLLLPRLRRRR